MFLYFVADRIIPLWLSTLCYHITYMYSQTCVKQPHTENNRDWPSKQGWAFYRTLCKTRLDQDWKLTWFSSIILSLNKTTKHSKCGEQMLGLTLEFLFMKSSLDLNAQFMFCWNKLSINLPIFVQLHPHTDYMISTSLY